MKITKIEQEENSYNIYKVTFTPNWLETYFNTKEKIKKYKDTGNTYSFGGGHVYINQNGEQLGNNMGYGSNIREKIDNWRNKF